MRLIDIENFIPSYENSDLKFEGGYESGFADGILFTMNKLNDLSTIDAIEVIRCKNCEYRADGLYCRRIDKKPYIVCNFDYCSNGKCKKVTK